MDCPGFAWPGWGLTTTTPTDQIALLRELVGPSTLLTDAQRDNVLQLMENVTPSQRWGVTGGVPRPATVALKNGWLPLNGARTDWQINSIGWVSGSGRDYLMAVLTTGNPTEQYGIDTINQLSAIVWGRCDDRAELTGEVICPKGPDRELNSQSWLVRYRVRPYFAAIAFHMLTKAVLSLVAWRSGVLAAW